MMSSGATPRACSTMATAKPVRSLPAAQWIRTGASPAVGSTEAEPAKHVPVGLVERMQLVRAQQRVMPQAAPVGGRDALETAEVARAAEVDVHCRARRPGHYAASSTASLSLCSASKAS